MAADHGPWNTKAEVHASTPAQRLSAARDSDDPEPGLKFMLDACARAGVKLGAEDIRQLRWLAPWEIVTVTVIADLITRAHEAGCKDA